MAAAGSSCSSSTSSLSSGIGLRALGTFTGHTGQVRGVCWVGGDRIVSASWDRTLKLWSATEQRLLGTFEGHKGSVYCVCWLGDGRIASGSGDDTVKIWDTETRACLQTLSGHRGPVWSVCVLGDGRLVSGSWDRTVKVWSVATGTCLGTCKGHSGVVWSVAGLEDGRLVSASEDKTLKLWDAATQACRGTFTGHTSGVYDVVSVGGGRIVSASNDGTLRLWSEATQACLGTFSGHTERVFGVAVLGPDKIISCGAETALRVWDVSTQACCGTYPTDHTRLVWRVGVLPDGRVVTASWDTTLKLFDSSAKLAAGSESKAAESTTFCVGDRVKARRHGGEHWHSGRITAVSAGGTWRLTYDDGDIEDGVSAALMSRIDATPAPAPAPMLRPGAFASKLCIVSEPESSISYESTREYSFRAYRPQTQEEQAEIESERKMKDEVMQLWRNGDTRKDQWNAARHALSDLPGPGRILVVLECPNSLHGANAIRDDRGELVPSLKHLNFQQWGPQWRVDLVDAFPFLSSKCDMCISGDSPEVDLAEAFMGFVLKCTRYDLVVCCGKLAQMVFNDRFLCDSSQGRRLEGGFTIARDCITSTSVPHPHLYIECDHPSPPAIMIGSTKFDKLAAFIRSLDPLNLPSLEAVCVTPLPQQAVSATESSPPSSTAAALPVQHKRDIAVADPTAAQSPRKRRRPF